MCAKLLQSCLSLCDPHGLQPIRFLCPWDSRGKKTGVGGHFLLQGIFLTQGLNPCLLSLLHWVLYHQRHLQSPQNTIMDSILHYRIDCNSKISHCHFLLNENNGLVVALNVIFQNLFLCTFHQHNKHMKVYFLCNTNII